MAKVMEESFVYLFDQLCKLADVSKQKTPPLNAKYNLDPPPTKLSKNKEKCLLSWLYVFQINKAPPPWSKLKIVSLLLNAARIVFWAIFSEFVLHYLYFNSVQQDTLLMEQIPLWSLAGIGYCHGQFFMVKFLVITGVPGILAKTDHLEPPKAPRCISWVYLYSQMWR